MNEHADQLGWLWAHARGELWEALLPTLGEARRAILEGRPHNHVQYRQADETSADGGARYFSLRDTDTTGLKPLIALFRDRVPADRFTADTSTRPHDDLILLAHEFGHFLSDKAGHHTAEYVTARALLNERERGKTHESLSRTQAQLVLDEEERAWTLGRNVLRGHGFEDLTQFDSARERGLETYRAELQPALEQH